MDRLISNEATPGNYRFSRYILAEISSDIDEEFDDIADEQLRLDGDDFTIPDMCPDDAVLATTTIALAGRINGLHWFPAAAGF